MSREVIENEEAIEDGDRAEHYDMEGETDENHWPRATSRSRSPQTMTSMQYPRAMVNGGILYVPDEQSLTERALRRHRRLMARVEGHEVHGRTPSRAASSAPSDALLTCSAWPVSPPPAQPDMIPRPIEDDLGPVGAIRAYPYTKAIDVVEKIIDHVQAY